MRHLPGYAVWGLCALLVVGASSLGQDPPPDPGPTDEQEALATVDSLRTAIGLETRAYHHLELGKTYEKMDRRGDAVEQYRRALEAPRADPFDPEYKRGARAHLSELE